MDRVTSTLTSTDYIRLLDECDAHGLVVTLGLRGAGFELCVWSETPPVDYDAYRQAQMDGRLVGAMHFHDIEGLDRAAFLLRPVVGAPPPQPRVCADCECPAIEHSAYDGHCLHVHSCRCAGLR